MRPASGRGPDPETWFGMRTPAPAWITNGLLVLGGVLLVLLCVEGIFAFALSHPADPRLEGRHGRGGARVRA